MKMLAASAFILIGGATAMGQPTLLHEADRSAQFTSFQCAAPYSPLIDVRSDVAIVYGVNETLAARIAEWKRQGYVAHMMTGSAWGEYEAYIDGRFDGSKHADEGQVDPQGNVIWHHPGMPYMVPTPSFVEYLKSLARQSIDAGAEALHFEEPEFWARAGYSEGFKRLWKAEYNEEWQRPDSSPDAFWRGSKLKYLLYKRTLEEVFRDAKEYSRAKGREVRCFVPTHSLLNYSQWAIVSPESSLMDLDNCDGYIAQVWTGTARTQNSYRGKRAERTFETAFLEYATMHSMTAPTGRTVYFLADPVEDDPNHTWDDYKDNYERVVTASLLYPEVNHFEVMPWPDRVMGAPYPSGSYSEKEKITIPPSYASELMTVVNALADVGHADGGAKWECGSSNVAVLASDTMMFQRGNPWEWDLGFNEYYGLALPLVKHGIPARCVVLERVLDTDAFEGVGVLLMSYEHMKPMRPEYNEAIARWVRDGGTLIYFGDDSDRFHGVREWWNKEGATTTTAREDLFAKLGVTPGVAPTRAGKGVATYLRIHPAALASSKDGATTVTQMLEAAMKERGLELETRNHLLLRRGPYVTGAVLSESISRKALTVKGTYVDLYSTDLAIVTNPSYKPGEVFLLRDVVAGNGWLGSNLRLERAEEVKAGECRLTLRGPASVKEGLARVRLKEPPKSAGDDVQVEWDKATKTALLRFVNKEGGVKVLVSSASLAEALPRK